MNINNLLITLLILYYIIFKIINFKKYIKSDKQKSIIVIVARYNEDLKWINTDPFNKFKYIVYNKCINDNFEKNNVIKIINLPNVGRDCHTFLYHIYNNYYNLNDITIFLPMTKILTDKLLITDFFESTNNSNDPHSDADETNDSNKTEVNEEIENFYTLDIDIVNNIFYSLIDDNIIQDYKKLCYSIFVKQKEDIIFYDYSDNDYVLSEWLLNIMKIIFPDCVYEYNENNIKNIKLEIPRMVIVDSNNISESQLNDIITEIKNIGIKNIIIKNSTKNIYKSKIEYNKSDLYYTYFKWCCTK